MVQRPHISILNSWKLLLLKSFLKDFFVSNKGCGIFADENVWDVYLYWNNVYHIYETLILKTYHILILMWLKYIICLFYKVFFYIYTVNMIS